MKGLIYIALELLLDTCYCTHPISEQVFQEQKNFWLSTNSLTEVWQLPWWPWRVKSWKGSKAMTELFTSGAWQIVHPMKELLNY